MSLLLASSGVSMYTLFRVDPEPNGKPSLQKKKIDDINWVRGHRNVKLDHFDLQDTNVFYKFHIVRLGTPAANESINMGPRTLRELTRL